jgi:hypothetical protein
MDFQRLDNGMVVNEDRDEMKKQNMKIALKGAAMASGGGAGSLFDLDTRAISEYYAELLSYAPSILTEATKKGNPFERFKDCIKFAFSILHCMILQDVVQKQPVTPLMGETYEGIYLLSDQQVDVFMESVFSKQDIKVLDLHSGQTRGVIKRDQEVTYVLIDGPNQSFRICGNLTYNQALRGNNMVISLLGTLNVKFKDLGGDDQVIQI